MSYLFEAGYPQPKLVRSMSHLCCIMKDINNFHSNQVTSSKLLVIKCSSRRYAFPRRSVGTRKQVQT